MKAIVVHQFGGPEVLACERVPLPQPGPGQVRVKIEAAGVNFVDIFHRRGPAGRLPFTPGIEGAGVVDAVGPQGADLPRGERVAFAMLPQGTYAQYIIVPVEKLVSIPDDIDTQQAAAVMLQGMTAHYLSHDCYAIQRGDTALIHAAAGGVGLLLVQMAKQRGARVIGTASTEEKARVAGEAGADEVILYAVTDFEQEVKRLTDGRGVDVVYDSVGATTFGQSLSCLRPRGYLVLFGNSSGWPSVDPKALAKGSLYLTRPGLGHYVRNREELLQRTGDLFQWMLAGELQVRVDKALPLADASEAHRRLEGRQTKGKLLLVPDFA